MNLRNFLLLFSALMISFCFGLYFQTDTHVQSMSFDQYKDLTYNESRSHSLEEFDQKIAPFKMEDIISEIYEKNKLAGEKTRVMEIGAGNGRVLMTLKKLFPDVEFYGINKEKTHTFYRRESFIHTALKFNLFTPDEIKAIDLPYVVFQDLDFGAKIPYADGKFDLIFSQGVLPYIRYKFELFNEILRVLKKDGVSFHSDFTMNLYAGGVALDIKDAMKELRKRGTEIYVLENPSSLRFKKTGQTTLFPVVPHIPIPVNADTVSEEQRRTGMGYNLLTE